MAAKMVYTLTYTGRSGHGSTPHKCIDPIIAAASFVTAAQSVVSKNTDPFAPSICAVSSINAGSPDEPMPDRAVMTGFFRSYDPDTHKHIEERVRKLAVSTAEAYECKCDILFENAADTLINSDEMYEIAYKAAELAVGKEHITDSKACLASEDFPAYSRYMPSFFYWVGSGEPGCENAPWHDANFRIGEGYFKTAVPVLVASALV